MTDDNVRPEANPSRESRPEGLEEGIVDDATADGKDVAEPAEAVADDATHDDGATDGDEAGVAVEAGIESMDADDATETDTRRVEADVIASGAEETPVVRAGAGDQRSDTFTWHPDHKGKTFDEVRASVAQDLAADQRQHRLAMDGAEESEQEALASVVGLERKWGKYDFDWAEQEPDALADRIVDFERERERRRQMISWSDYRDGAGSLGDAQAEGDRPAELSTSAKGLSLLLVVLLIVVILLSVWAL